MKHIFAIVIVINFISSVYGQGLIESINNLYQSLDTVQYVLDIKSAEYKDIKKRYKEGNEAILELYADSYNETIADSVRRIYLLDSLTDVYKKSAVRWVKESYNNFIFIFNESKKVEFVLSLHLEKDSIDGKIHYSLKPSTGKFPFHIFLFYKYPYPIYFFEVGNGEYFGYQRYATTSRKWAESVSKAFKEIMKKKPKYLLYCNELEQMNTILYVVGDKIYVYRIVEQEEYEIGDYIEKFKMHSSPYLR
ncbi:MAG: hypothetical protein LBR81_10080 [Prevotellaceae bacterium]|jgi:hypothetical protein|nr:hypothetical protein [Prevotellaceae bacterium]